MLRLERTKDALRKPLRKWGNAFGINQIGTYNGMIPCFFCGRCSRLLMSGQSA